MIQISPAASRPFSDFGWLKTYWLFSFSRYLGSVQYPVWSPEGFQ